MDDLFSLYPSPVFLRRDALAAGYSDRDLRQASAAGAIHRIRHGAYVDASAWNGASVEAQHLMLADAVIRSHDAPLALSHTSAAVAHGLRTYQQDLSKVHVLCLDDSIGRTHADVVYHHTTPRSREDMKVVSERLVVPPTRAALEAALLTGVRNGLVVVDSALNLGLSTVDDIEQEFLRIEGARGSQALRLTVKLARSGSESVGASLGRYLMWRHHIPEPVLQYEVRDAEGNLVARLDWTWPELGLCAEFDGREKYTRFLRPGEAVPTSSSERRRARISFGSSLASGCCDSCGRTLTTRINSARSPACNRHFGTRAPSRADQNCRVLIVISIRTRQFHNPGSETDPPDGGAELRLSDPRSSRAEGPG